MYETISVAAGGRTVGKAIAGVRLVTSAGDRVGFPTALGRPLLVSWSSTAAGTLALVSSLRWPPAGLFVALGWALVVLLPVASGHRSWLDAATGTEVVRTIGT